MIILDKKQAQQNIPCPACNGTMAATQTERGAFFVCGGLDLAQYSPASHAGNRKRNGTYSR